MVTGGCLRPTGPVGGFDAGHDRLGWFKVPSGVSRIHAAPVHQEWGGFAGRPRPRLPHVRGLTEGTARRGEQPVVGCRRCGVAGRCGRTPFRTRKVPRPSLNNQGRGRKVAGVCRTYPNTWGSDAGCGTSVTEAAEFPRTSPLRRTVARPPRGRPGGLQRTGRSRVHPREWRMGWGSRVVRWLPQCGADRGKQPSPRC